MSENESKKLRVGDVVNGRAFLGWVIYYTGALAPGESGCFRYLLRNPQGYFPWASSPRTGLKEGLKFFDSYNACRLRKVELSPALRADTCVRKIWRKLKTPTTTSPTMHVYRNALRVCGAQTWSFCLASSAVVALRFFRLSGGIGCMQRLSDQEHAIVYGGDSLTAKQIVEAFTAYNTPWLPVADEQLRLHEENRSQ